MQTRRWTAVVLVLFCGCGGEQRHELPAAGPNDPTPEEQKAFLDFLTRKKPEAAVVQIMDWSAVEEGTKRTVEVHFRTTGKSSMGKSSIRSIWTGRMVSENGKIASKQAVFIKPAEGEKSTEQPEPNLIISE